MTGSIQLSAVELRELVAAVLEYNGYQMTHFTVTEDGGASCTVNIDPLSVKTDRTDEQELLKAALYPEVNINGRIAH